MWMIRAGRGGASVDTFVQQSMVAIGWSAAPEIPVGVDREAVMAKLQAAGFGAGNRNKLANGAGQIWRFLNEVQIGDDVVTYDQSRRVYLVGKISGDPQWQPEHISNLPRTRAAVWHGEALRDDLSAPARNSLGSISTIFRLPEEVAEELRARAAGKSLVAGDGSNTAGRSNGDSPEDDDVFDAAQTRSMELIKDRISRLDPEEFEELVAGLLRAMGYRTRVSAKGPDRGVDIMASPDGLGFEQPRIVVECKHRVRTAMGAPAIRSFLGGRHPDDKGLYVSSGGFTQEARYEAERASIPLALMDLDQLALAITENYESCDSSMRALLPLGKVYWPAE